MKLKLSVPAMALACGLIWGLGLFALTWWILAFDGSSEGTPFLGQIYRGYKITPQGSVIGLVWALGDGAIGGAIFAWVYNLFVAKLHGNATAATT